MFVGSGYKCTMKNTFTCQKEIYLMNHLKNCIHCIVFICFKLNNVFYSTNYSSDNSNFRLFLRFINSSNWSINSPHLTLLLSLPLHCDVNIDIVIISRKFLGTNPSGCVDTNLMVLCSTS